MPFLHRRQPPRFLSPHQILAQLWTVEVALDKPLPFDIRFLPWPCPHSCPTLVILAPFNSTIGNLISVRTAHYEEMQIAPKKTLTSLITLMERHFLWRKRPLTAAPIHQFSPTNVFPRLFLIICSRSHPFKRSQAGDRQSGRQEAFAKQNEWAQGGSAHVPSFL